MVNDTVGVAVAVLVSDGVVLIEEVTEGDAVFEEEGAAEMDGRLDLLVEGEAVGEAVADCGGLELGDALGEDVHDGDTE